jgi:tetratricopeptide (TPR) repeat protein
VLAASLALLLCSAAQASDPAEQRRQEAVAHYRAGQNALLGEDWMESEREFREAIRLDPLLAAAHYALGQVYMATKRYPDAVRAYASCRDAFHAQDSDRLMNEKVAEQRIEAQVRALRDYLRLLQSGRYNRSPGLTVSAIQRTETQIRDLERRKLRGENNALETPPGVSLALGSAYFRNGAFGDAEREYRAALDADPDLGEAHNNLAVVYMLSGRLDEAEKAVQQAERAGFRVNPQLKKDIEARKAQR